MSEPMKDDPDRLLEWLKMAAEGIAQLEVAVADLQADCSAYRLLIGHLLVRSPEAIAAATRDHASVEELTLPLAMTEPQRERLAATLGQILAVIQRAAPP